MKATLDLQAIYKKGTLDPKTGKEKYNLKHGVYHNYRVVSPANADPSKSHLNRIIFGPETADELLIKIDEIFDKTKIDSRSTRIAVEIVLAPPAEYIRPDNKNGYGEYNEEKLVPWLEQSIKWAKDEAGADLISAILHLDETTPHLHVQIIPTKHKEKDNSSIVDYRDKYDGARNLRRLHDSYAKFMAPLGISRGDRGHKPKAETIKNYYKRVNSAQEILNEVPEVKPLEPDPLGNINFDLYVKQLNFLKAQMEVFYEKVKNFAITQNEKAASLHKSLIKEAESLKQLLNQKNDELKKSQDSLKIVQDGFNTLQEKVKSLENLEIHINLLEESLGESFKKIAGYSEITNADITHCKKQLHEKYPEKYPDPDPKIEKQFNTQTPTQ